MILEDLPEDFTIGPRGQVHGLPPRTAFQYGERYVRCRHCGSLRAPFALFIKNMVPVCQQHREQAPPGFVWQIPKTS